MLTSGLTGTLCPVMRILYRCQTDTCRVVYYAISNGEQRCPGCAKVGMPAKRP